MDPEAAEAAWRDVLSGRAPEVRLFRRRFKRLPASPRCKLCYAPYGGIGGLALRPWFGPWERNPQLCKACFRWLSGLGVSGAEVELSMLFADIRGSTALGERLRPAAFSALLGAFYRLAADAIVAEDGIVDKFVGDEAIGLFIPGYAGPDHAARAVAAARRLLAAAGSRTASPDGPIPVGAAVHTGVAFVGSVGANDEISDFTALGDAMNTTARLASLAAAGELLVSADAAAAAGVDRTGLDARVVDVRGREAQLEVLAFPVADTDRPPSG
jgi:adenylate cyclase